jgi:hypothetical protein
MIWVVGNVPLCNCAEMFAAELVAPAPLLESFSQEFAAGMPAILGPISGKNYPELKTITSMRAASFPAF